MATKPVTCWAPFAGEFAQKAILGRIRPVTPRCQPDQGGRCPPRPHPMLLKLPAFGSIMPARGNPRLHWPHARDLSLKPGANDVAKLSSIRFCSGNGRPDLV